MSHTPLPWKVSPKRAYVCTPTRNVAFIVDAGDECREENAQLIVRAVNNHDALLTALRECMTWMDERDPDHQDARRNFERVIRQAES